MRNQNPRGHRNMPTLHGYPFRVGFQNRIVELGELRRCFDIRRVSRHTLVALNVGEWQEVIANIVQLVKAGIAGLIGLDVPAVNILTVGCQKDTRSMFL